MAIQTLSTIKSWFRTNLKPTQSQFWDTWDSFRHKNEKVPVGDLEGIDELLQDKIEREVFENHLTDPNAHAESLDKKLDKGGYNGTGKNLDDRITAIETPDRVLKFGVLTLSGLNLTITSNAFAWIVNKLQFSTPGSFAKTLTAATSGMYRTDIVVGNQSGTYEVITGFEAATGTAAVEPSPPTGTIKLGFISLLGNTVVNSGSAPAIEKPTIVDADRIVIDDSETSFAKKSVKFLNFKAALKTYFDTIYQSFMGISTITGTTYQLLLTDNGKKIVCTSATAVALTIPTNVVVALPIGARIKITQQGDGVITFTTTGLTIVSSSPLYTIKGQTVTLEKTAVNTWTIEGNNLNGEIRLAAFPNTRNDGQISTNRVLGTDVNGNLKLYTIAVSPAPWINELIPDSYFPDTTGNIKISGDFFTPQMCDRINNPSAILIGGVTTINYAIFVNSQELRINVTTGSLEGSFSCTLNNGLSTTKDNALLITFGEVIKPQKSDYVSITEPIDLDKTGSILVKQYNVPGSAKIDPGKIKLESGRNFRFDFSLSQSPMGFTGVDSSQVFLSLFRVSDDVEVYQFSFYQLASNLGYTQIKLRFDPTLSQTYLNDSGVLTNNALINFSFRRINGVLTLYRNLNVMRVIPYVETQDMYMVFSVRRQDITNIKYLKLT